MGSATRALAEEADAEQTGFMIEWLEPWEDVSRETGEFAFCEAWERQLAREVGPQHVLFGKQVELIGRRFDCDEALFRMPDGRVAQVHVTWRNGMEPDPTWPETEIFPSIEAWAQDSMRLQHLYWIE